jgi:hypothetical protein
MDMLMRLSSVYIDRKVRLNESRKMRRTRERGEMLDGPELLGVIRAALVPHQAPRKCENDDAAQAVAVGSILKGPQIRHI